VFEKTVISGEGVGWGGGLAEIVLTLNKSIHSGWRLKIFERIMR